MDDEDQHGLFDNQLVPQFNDLELRNMIFDRLNQLTRQQLIAILNFLHEIIPLVHRGPRRRIDRAEVVNPWVFHVAREQAIRRNVNDPQHPDYDENHEYFGRSAIDRRPRDVSPDEWENNSIMPFMKQKFAENKEQIILDMINEQDVFTSDNEDPTTYWSLKSSTAKNSYIEKIKREYPQNALIQALQPVENI